MNLKSPIELIDLEPKAGNLLKEVLVGLSRGQKALHPKFLYDEKGSDLFEKICSLPEYYLTNAEMQILKKYSKEMSRLIGPDALIIEPGSGVGLKVRLLLKKLERPAGYVPIEISRDVLLKMVEEIQEEFPKLRLLPVCADFTQEIDLPLSLDSQKGRKILFFPGSTIGNLAPDEAVQFLKKYGKLIGSGGGALIGVDLKKEREKLEIAYNDPGGVTAAFNLNVLKRLNRELDASFDLENFSHEAVYNEDLGRVEMHLKSNISQLVRVNQTVFRFHEGETIHTESSYKYSLEEFCELGAKAKLKIRKYWKDPDNLYCVYFFEKE